jgi:transmembrane protein EpsG
MFDQFTYFVYCMLLVLVICLLSLNIGKQQKTAPEIIDKANKLNIEHFAALLLISLVVGLRHEVGVDWAGYKADYEQILGGNVEFSEQYMEVGFYAISKVIASLGGTHVILFFCAAFISWYFIFNCVPVTLLPLTVFYLFADEYFFWSMNGVRQFIAISIFLYSVRFIINRNLREYLLFIVLAALFHNSVILLIPLYYVPFQVLYNQLLWLVVFVISLLVGQNQLFVSGLQFAFTKVAGVVPLVSTYTRYFDMDKYYADDVSIRLGFVFKMAIALFVLITSGEIVKRYPKTKIYFVLYFIGAVIFNLFYRFQLVGRFNQYFLIMRPVSLAIIIYHFWSNRKYKIVSIVVSLLYFLVFLQAIYRSSNMCAPFQLCFRQ